MGRDVETAAVDLERIKRKEIRELDTYETIALLCGDSDYLKRLRVVNKVSSCQ